MEKIHNNLNIENLTKTEWFNQFNKGQQKEILKGLKNNEMFLFMLTRS